MLNSSFVLRDACFEDSERLSVLARQLGYPVATTEVASRLVKYSGNPSERVIVAVKDGEVIGWTSAGIVDHFYTPIYVEISGLVVDESSRGSGAGKFLVDEVKRWTVEKGITLLRLRANVIRKDAHRFYEREGFKRRKEQVMFEWTFD
jgi:GNAT superfamily N-acetyltransferase